MYEWMNEWMNDGHRTLAQTQTDRQYEDGKDGRQESRKPKEKNYYYVSNVR